MQQLRVYLKWQWRVDEVFVKINVERHYLWHALDHEGEVLEAVASKKRRNKWVALTFFKLMRRQGTADEAISDRFTSNRAALKELGAKEKTTDGQAAQQSS